MLSSFILPRSSIWKCEPLDRLGLHGDAVTPTQRRQVTSISDRSRIDEVLMQMVDEFYSPAVERTTHRNIVKDRKVLNIFAKPAAARVRANRDTAFCRHQKHRENFIDAAEPATVDLAEVDRTGLEELLEHNAVVAMLAGSDTDRGDALSDRGMAENVVGTRRLFDP